MNPDTLQDLAAALRDRGRRPAVGLRRDFGARWWTYRQLYEATCAAAALFRDRDVQQGQRVLLWASNCPEWVACLLGAALRGVVVVPLDEGASLDQARRIATEVEAVLVLHGEDQDGAALGVRAEPIHVVSPGCAGSHEHLLVPVQPDAEAVILFTSGTTMRPKGVILTHRNLTAQMGAVQRFGGMVRFGRVRIMVLAPLSHSQGLLLGICIPLWVGLTVLYSGSIEPTHLVRTIRDNRVTMLSTVPRVAQTLAATLRRMPSPGRRGGTLDERMARWRRPLLRRLVVRRNVHRMLGNQFRVLFVGGADLSPADEEFWRLAGCMVIQGYGLTETAAIVSVNRVRGGRLGSIGKPLAHQTVELAPDGEILVRGPNVAAGYLGGDPGDSSSIQDGVLRTGDLAVRDSRNRLYFVGRKKDIIVTSEGFNVHPDEVESVVRGIEGVRDIVVMAREREGTVGVHAALLLHDGADIGRIVQRANRQLESHQLIRSWSVYPDDDFPRTSLLKVKRPEVAERLRTAAPSNDEEPAPTLEAILALGDRDRRLRLLAAHLATGPLANGNGHGTPTLREVGLSSLETVELLSLIETRTGVPLDRVAVSPEADLRDLAALVTNRGAEEAESSRLPIEPPAWSRRRIGRLLRGVTQPVLGRLWARRWGRPLVSWTAPDAALTGPVIIAAAPHRHYHDGFAVYHALPRRLRRNLVVVTNYRFDEASAPTQAQGRRRRRQIRRMYGLILPLSFDFVILPHAGTTRYGLYDLGRLIDQGRSPLTFPKGLFMGPDDLRRHDPGVAMIALETQTPVLPVWLEQNDGFNERRRGRRRPVVVRVGELIAVTRATSREELVERIESAFNELAT
jgi:long-chain acyl-CoA synthetase